MSGLDKTGPMGQGPKTGKGTGSCEHGAESDQCQQTAGLGFGKGRGRNRGFGGGRADGGHRVRNS